MPQDPLARMGLARSPVMKLLQPSQQELDSPAMTEDMRNFFLRQQNIEGNLAEMQRQAAASQTGLQAETAAQQYYQQPPTARQRFLDENPQTWSSSAGPGIEREMAFQRRMPSLADRTLAPTIASKLPVTARGEFMSLIEAGTPVLEAKQAVEMKEYNRGLRAKMAEVMTPEEIEQGYGSDDAPLDEVRVMSEIAQRKSGRATPSDRLKNLVEAATKRLERLTPGGFAPTAEDDEDAFKQYQAALKDVEEAESAYMKALRRESGLLQEESSTPPPGSAAPGSAAPGSAAPGSAPSFRQTMQKAVPKVEEILKVDQTEVLKDLDDPAADENTYTAAIDDPSTSIEVKQAALDRLKNFAEKPRKISGLTLGKAEERKKALNQMVQDAEKKVKMLPEVERYRQAWDKEKAQVAGWIKDFADEMGVDAEELENSLAANEPVNKDDVASFTQAPKRTYNDAFAEFLRKKKGVNPTTAEAPNLAPFKQSEFAKELGMKRGDVESLLGGSVAGSLLVPYFGPLGAALGEKILPSSKKTYSDVLDAYLAEKQKPVAAGSPEGKVAGPPKIQIGQPRKVQ